MRAILGVAGIAILTSTFAVPRAIAQPPNAPTGVRLQVPSKAAGQEGVAVLLVVPEKPRYGQAGAPVVVTVPGGLGAGSFGGDAGAAEAGFVSIQFTFPGGEGSGGVYDQRGPLCLEALRDVARFALGLQADSKGKKLQDHAGGVLVLTKNVGLIGLSNGGNQTIAVAGLHGKDLPSLAWIVNWESPVGPGAVNGEMGTQMAAPPGAKAKPKADGAGPGNPRVNPAHDPETGKSDLSKLAFDPQLEVQAFPRPGVGGPPKAKPGAAARGGLYIDANRNGKVDPGIDFILRPVPTSVGQGRMSMVYSTRVLEEAEGRKLYGEKRPDHIASADQAREFWHYRDGVHWAANAVGHNPKLLFLVVAGARDHVQSAPDYPHIRAQYDAFLQARARFARVNPDRAYVQTLAGPGVEAVDNQAGMRFDPKTIRAAVAPEPANGGATTRILQLAALCELADRTQSDTTAPQLDAVLYKGPEIRKLGKSKKP